MKKQALQLHRAAITSRSTWGGRGGRRAVRCSCFRFVIIIMLWISRETFAKKQPVNIGCGCMCCSCFHTVRHCNFTTKTGLIIMKNDLITRKFWKLKIIVALKLKQAVAVEDVDCCLMIGSIHSFFLFPHLPNSFSGSAWSLIADRLIVSVIRLLSQTVRYHGLDRGHYRQKMCVI